MKLLSGMVREPRISDTAVSAERGVVLSELRESNGPQKRIADATAEHLFAGQLLGDRSPIGTIQSLDAARAPAVQAFHDRWYRPARAVGVIAGDGAPAEFAPLLRTDLADWKAEGAHPKHPHSGNTHPKDSA